MTLFEYLSIGVSLVLGLGVTLLLTSLLAAFRARRHARMDWIPFAWAGYVLAIQAQYEYPTDRSVYFEQDGRWAVALVGCEVRGCGSRTPEA